MNKRNHSIDSLKFFCILGVVCIHTSPFSGIEFGFIGSKYLSTTLNTIARTCVPLFFISSGYFFYNKANKEYTKKYVINLIKVLFTWSIIYISYNIYIKIISNSNNCSSIFNATIEYLSTFKIMDLYYATGIVYYHLWYLSATIIVIPTLYYIIKNNLLEIALKISIILNIIGVIVPVFISNSLAFRVRDAIFLGLFYSVLGVYINIHEYEIKSKIQKICIFKYLCMIIFLFGVSMIEKYIYITRFKGAGEYFISTIPLSILIFSLCLVNSKLFKDTIISKLGKHTFGIYIIHPLILSIVSIVLFQLNIENITSTIIWHIFYTPIVLIVSYSTYNAIQKVKISILKLLIKKVKYELKCSI